MSWLSTVRLVTFVTTVLFSIIVVALSAALIALTEPVFYWKFSAFALATGLLTVITTVPMFIVDLARKGAFFSHIVVEIVWLSVLWVLWLSSGSYAAWTDDQIASQFSEESTCSFGVFGDVSGANQGCGEIKAIMAFSFLLWILLATYTSILLGLSIRALSRGHSAWKTSVRDGTLIYPTEKASMSPAQGSAPPVTVPHSHHPASPQPFPNTIANSFPGIAQV